MTSLVRPPVIAGAGAQTEPGRETRDGSTLRNFTDGKLNAADYWTDKPEILSAGMGFDNIIGLPDIPKETAREAGGSWYGGLNCMSGKNPSDDLMTSAAPLLVRMLAG